VPKQKLSQDEITLRFDLEYRGKAVVNAKAIIDVGIALILLGVVAFTYQGGGGTGGEQGVDFGIVHAGVDTMKTIVISPFLGAIGLVSGIVLVAVGINKST
jgi:hypothetical protein